MDMNKRGFNKGVLALLLGVSILGACVVGGYAINDKRDVWAAQWHFSNGPFKLMAVEKQAGQVMVKLLASKEQSDMDVITYRNCPFQDEAIWDYQTRDNIALAYFIEKQSTGNGPQLAKKASEVNSEIEAQEMAYTQVAITICDSHWSVSREVNALSALDQP